MKTERVRRESDIKLAAVLASKGYVDSARALVRRHSSDVETMPLVVIEVDRRFDHG